MPPCKGAANTCRCGISGPKGLCSHQNQQTNKQTKLPLLRTAGETRHLYYTEVFPSLPCTVIVHSIISAVFLHMYEENKHHDPNTCLALASWHRSLWLSGTFRGSSINCYRTENLTSLPPLNCPGLPQAAFWIALSSDNKGHFKTMYPSDMEKSQGKFPSEHLP